MEHYNGSGRAFVMMARVSVVVLSVLVLSASVLEGGRVLFSAASEPRSLSSLDPAIAEMISQISEAAIYATVFDLQSFQTRVWGYPGNTEAGTYLCNRFSDISGLSVEYQGGDLRNVIATLPGVDGTSDTVYMTGAHYDSISSDPSDAPGATDNGGGVAIVLELARIMSQYEFRHTVKFACWNHEEGGSFGSRDYVSDAYASAMDIGLYFNFDSACYDPDDRMILDVMYNTQSAWVSDLITQHNSLYAIDFTLTHNAHGCSSDHRSFWEYGYTAVMTHEETHGPAHTPSDTVDKVSTAYAAKNGRIGLSVLAELAEVQGATAVRGDFDHDNDVDIFDIVMIASIYGATSGDPWFNEECDLDGDGVIGLYDVVLTAGNYGRSW